MAKEIVRALRIILQRTCDAPEDAIDILDELYYELTGMNVKLIKKEKDNETVNGNYRKKDDHMPDL